MFSKNITVVKGMVLASLVAVFSLNLSGCVQGNGSNIQIAGVNGPTVELVNGYFILSIAFTDVSVDGGLTLPIPKYPNSSLAIGPDFQTGGLLLVLSISVADFTKNSGLNFFDPQTLPGGRPLPGVSQGFLPAVALQVPQLFNTVFYVGPKVIGFFVPTHFDPSGGTGGILTVSFFDNSGVRVGNLSLVGADTSRKNAGILVLISIDTRIQTAINNQLAKL